MLRININYIKHLHVLIVGGGKIFKMAGVLK